MLGFVLWQWYCHGNANTFIGAAILFLASPTHELHYTHAYVHKNHLPQFQIHEHPQLHHLYQPMNGLSDSWHINHIWLTTVQALTWCDLVPFSSILNSDDHMQASYNNAMEVYNHIYTITFLRTFWNTAIWLVAPIRWWNFKAIYHPLASNEGTKDDHYTFIAEQIQ